MHALYNWKKLRFRVDQADIRAIQSDPVARDNPAVMQRRAFRLRGLMLPLSVASNLTKSCDTRQRSIMALNLKRSLAAVFANIQTPARPTAAQMAAPVVPSQPVPNPVSHTVPPPAPLQALEPRQKCLFKVDWAGTSRRRNRWPTSKACCKSCIVATKACTSH